jgi:hypothetical protein
MPYSRDAALSDWYENVMAQLPAPRFDPRGSAQHSMSAVIGDSAPVYDPLALMSLADEVSEEAAQRFLEEYVGLLTQRRTRIVQALNAGSAKAAMDAIVSLKVTSSIVGAAWLIHFCSKLQDQLRLGEPIHAAEIDEELDVLVSTFISAVNAAP